MKKSSKARLILTEKLPLISFLLSLFILFILFRPLLSPILDSGLNFAYGDFSSIIGVDSGLEKYQMIYYTFSQRWGAMELHIIRRFMPEGSIAALANVIPTITDSQITSIAILISIVLGCYGIFKICCIFEKEKRYLTLLIPSTTLFYFLNLWSTERLIHVWIWVAYAVFPLCIYFGLAYIFNENSKYLIVYSLLFGIYGIIPHNLIYIMILHVFLSIFLAVLSSKKGLKKLLSFICIPTAIYLLTNAPSLLLSFIAKGLEYPIPMSVNQLMMLSRNGYLINILTFTNNWWPRVPAAFLENRIFRVTSLILFIMAFSALLINSKREYKMLSILSSLFIIGLFFFIQGTNNPILLSIIHFCGQLGYIDIFAPFREWGRLSILIPIFLILLLLLGVSLLKGKKKFVLVFLCFTLITTNIISSPSLLYISEVYSPTYAPKEYYELRDEIPLDRKVLWVYPASAQSLLGTWRYVWNEQKAISRNLERSIGSTHNIGLEYVKMLTRKEAPQRLLNALNIKYVIKRTDILGASNFKVEYGYLKCNKREFLTICENPYNTTLFYISTILIVSDLDGKNFYAITFPSIPSHAAVITDFKDDIIKVAQAALYDFVSLWLYKIGENKGIILAPFKFTYFVNPEKVWSRASTADLLHTDWHPYLERFGIENWQSDYGKGLVFTWAVSRLEGDPLPTSNDLIHYWSFNSLSDLNQWKNYTPENQFKAIYTIALDEGSLRAELWNSTWGWKTINSPLIEVVYGNWYRWELQIRAENAHSVHMKIAEYDKNRKFIGIKYVKHIGSGTFGWQTIIINYVPENPETKYIQLQIWHGHETTQPLPNRIWVDNVKVYDLRRFVRSVTLEVPFTIPETREYIILTRLFQNQKGGKIQIQIDDKNYVIDTKDQLNKFVWKQVDTIWLEKGNHKIVLTNIEGFNAVNLFALIPKEEYENAQKQIQQILKDKKIIYILEAESDLYHKNCTMSNKYRWEASNGMVLELNQESKAYNTIEILKPGNYTFAIRCKGNLTVKIDENEYKIHSPQLNWAYIGPINLEKGEHIIEITKTHYGNYQPSDIDVIWLYLTQNKNETLENIFALNENPVEIISYRKINPTKYLVKVNATKPFMLSFAESYDPSWTAYVNGEKIQSIPLYGVINGFWINQTGLLEIIIEYEPQKWFYIGLMVSAATLIACIAYLIYDWARERGRKLSNLS